MTDEEIDYSDIPPLTDQFFENATLRIPATQEPQKPGFLLSELDQRTDYGEERWVGIGFLRNTVAVVVWTERHDNIMRIISARRANKYERQRFEQYLSD